MCFDDEYTNRLSQAIEAAVKIVGDEKLTPIKEHVGDSISWEEIKIVLAHRRYSPSTDK